MRLKPIKKGVPIGTPFLSYFLQTLLINSLGVS